MSLSCELCAASAPLSVAMLRVAWSPDRAIVEACRPCATRAWRTVAGDVKFTPIYAAPGRNPLAGLGEHDDWVAPGRMRHEVSP